MPMRDLSNDLADDPVLRLPLVQYLHVPLSKQRIYALMAKGLFPQSVSIGANAVGWRQSDILAYLQRVAAERAMKDAKVSRRRAPAPAPRAIVAPAHTANKSAAIKSAKSAPRPAVAK